MIDVRFSLESRAPAGAPRSRRDSPDLGPSLRGRRDRRTGVIELPLGDGAAGLEAISFGPTDQRRRAHPTIRPRPSTPRSHEEGSGTLWTVPLKPTSANRQLPELLL